MFWGLPRTHTDGLHPFVPVTRMKVGTWATGREVAVGNVDELLFPFLGVATLLLEKSRLIEKITGEDVPLSQVLLMH